MAGIPRYAFFPNAVAMKIETCFWSIDPDALPLHFHNDSAFGFHASDGYYWDIQEIDGLLFICGVSSPDLEDIAAREGRVPLNPPRTQVRRAEIGRKMEMIK